MNAGAGSAGFFAVPFAHVQQSVAQGDREEASKELSELEKWVNKAFAELDGQARAVADANARAVQLADKLSRLTSEL